MAKVTIGIILHADFDDADAVIETLRQQYGIELVHVQQSYGKLWIKKGDAP